MLSPTFKKIFKDCFTEDDNLTWDVDAFGWAFILISYVIISCVESATFSPLVWSGGAAALLAGRQVVDVFKKGKKNNE